MTAVIRFETPSDADSIRSHPRLVFPFGPPALFQALALQGDPPTGTVAYSKAFGVR